MTFEQAIEHAEFLVTSRSTDPDTAECLLVLLYGLDNIMEDRHAS